MTPDEKRQRQLELEQKYELAAIEKNRNMRVVKANELVRQGKNNLKKMELRLVNFAISRIKPSDTNLDEYYGFTIQEFCDCFDLDSKNGGNYRYIKQSLKRVADKSFYMEEGEKSVLVRWFSKVEITRGSGYIRVKFDPDMAKYLILLQDRGDYLSYILEYTRRLNRVESIKLYEVLKSYAYTMGPKAKTQKDFINTLEVREINYSFDDKDKNKPVKTKQSFKIFKSQVLDPALEEINKYSDIYVDYVPVKVGRTYKQIEFHIHRLDSVELFHRMQQLTAEEKRQELGVSNKKQIEGQQDIFSVYKETVQPFEE